jgi:hypothetical protein
MSQSSIGSLKTGFLAELEPVRQSGSGPAGPDKTGRNRIFAGFFSIFLPDFCRIFVSVTSKMNRAEFTGFFSIFLPDFLPDFCRIFARLTSKMIRPNFCQIGVKNDPAEFRPDGTGQILKLAGPDRMQKIRPVPTLVFGIPRGLFSGF